MIHYKLTRESNGGLYLEYVGGLEEEARGRMIKTKMLKVDEDDKECTEFRLMSVNCPEIIYNEGEDFTLYLPGDQDSCDNDKVYVSECNENLLYTLFNIFSNIITLDERPERKRYKLW